MCILCVQKISPIIRWDDFGLSIPGNGHACHPDEEYVADSFACHSSLHSCDDHGESLLPATTIMSVKTGRREEVRTRQVERNQSKQASQGVEEWDLPVQDARPLLPKASFFLGDLRDGLPMVSESLHATRGGKTQFLYSNINATSPSVKYASSISNIGQEFY